MEARDTLPDWASAREMWFVSSVVPRIWSMEILALFQVTREPSSEDSAAARSRWVWVTL